MVQNLLSNEKHFVGNKAGVFEESKKQTGWTQVKITLAFLALVGFVFGMFHVAYVLDSLLGFTANVYSKGLCLILFVVVMEIFSFVARAVWRWSERERYALTTVQIVALLLTIIGGLAIAGMFFWKTAFIIYQIGGDELDFANILMAVLVSLVGCACLFVSAYKWVTMN